MTWIIGENGIYEVEDDIEKTVKLGNTLMQQFGFVIIHSFHQFPVGKVLGLSNEVDVGNLPGPLIVIGYATQEEYERQCLVAGVDASCPLPGTYMHKVVAE